MLGRDVEVRCGHVTFKFKDLQGVFEDLRQMAQKTPKEIRPFIMALDQTPAGKVIWAKDTLQNLARGKADITLSTLFTLCRDQECSDIRDKVYGLLGLLTQSERGPRVLLADYSKTPAEVYQAVLTAETGNKDFIPETSSMIDLCNKLTGNSPTQPS